MVSEHSKSQSGHRFKIEYEVIPGFFIHDDLDTPADTIAAVPPRFGLKEASGGDWVGLKTAISRMNDHAPVNVFYKLIYLGRHGQGFHNVAEAYYGTEAWDSYWSLLNGDGTITWGPDPQLTDLGVLQAQEINTRWKEELSHSIPLPTRLFSSPLSRAARTLELCFGDIGIPKPLIMENLREVIGIHTCDKRSTRSYLQAMFPEFDIEADLTEEDELWRSDHRENEEEVNARIKAALDRVLISCSEDTYLMIFAHGGVINAIFHAINHRRFPVKTGGVVPVVIKGIIHNIDV